MGKYRKGVFIVTYAFENDKIYYAILKRHKHWRGWEFPKGGVDKNETELNAVKRELKEETGLKILKIKEFGVKSRYRYRKKLLDRKEIGQSYSLFAVEVRKGKVKIDRKEHSDFKWLIFDKAVKILKWPNQRKCLRIVDKRLGKVNVKSKYLNYTLCKK